MTEKDFRDLVRQQILEKFEREVRQNLFTEGNEVKPLPESVLREYIRNKLKDKFSFNSETK